MNIQFTYHATERINERLNGLIDIEECYEAIFTALKANPAAEYIDIKHFSKRIYLGNPALPETPKGDKITAKVVHEGNCIKVITVMLMKSTNQRFTK